MKRSAKVLDDIKKTCLDHRFESDAVEREFIRGILGVCVDYSVINNELMNRIMNSLGSRENMEEKYTNIVELPKELIQTPEIALYNKICEVMKQKGSPYIKLDDLIILHTSNYGEIITRDRILQVVKGIRHGEYVLDEKYDCIKHRDYSGECTETNMKDQSWYAYMNTTR
jgi:hypothetical protein